MERGGGQRVLGRLPRSGPWSVDAFVLSGPFAVAKDVLLDLAGGGLGEGAELDRRGAFEVRDPLAAELDDLALAGPDAVGQGDERLGPLAPALVGGRDDGALEHGGGGGGRVVDLG